jgi:hypothetical protein
MCLWSTSKNYDVTEKKKAEFAHAKKKCKKKNVTADGEIPRQLALGKTCFTLFQD